MEKLHSRKLLLHLWLLLPLLFSSLLLLSSAYTVPDKYFINCGASEKVTTNESPPRNFVGDQDFSGGKGKTVESSNSSIDTLYRTARVYERTSSYEFQINENGTYIVRLHFFVFSSSPDLSVALFDVWASGFSLLTNYSTRNITTSPRIEEFLLTIPQGSFKIYFIPSQESSLAFVNAIEVFLAPDNFFDDNSTNRITSAGVNVTYSGLISQVLHPIHRINVGGNYINGDDLWRNWVPDDNYLVLRPATMSNNSGSTPNYQSAGVTVYIAPTLVYQTAKQLNKNATNNSSVSNATWSFPAKKNATHFVRVHFCDVVSTTPNDLWFNLSINRNYTQTIIPYDRIQYLAAPFYLDFVVDPDYSGFMNVSIGALENSTIRDAFLNGLEIMEFMKKSNSTPMEIESKKKFSPVIIGVVSSGAFVILVVAVATGLKCRKREPDQSLVELLYAGFNSNNKSTESSNVSLAPNLNLSLRISFAEIRRATENFNAKHLIGKGGFGKVYVGTLRNGTTVAVKRSEGVGDGQGLHEFHTEIMVLSQIRYRHLVSLIGYCDEGNEMILVYEFMEKGTLRDHLYSKDGGSDKSFSLSELSWTQRLDICIGAAKGLDYLHTQAGRIIHRDVKSTNILLDKDYVAKVADFGLSKSGPPDPEHCTMAVKGSFGYFDPEYLATQQYTEKSDVYSFGVVLFEVLCARPPIDNSLPEEEVPLTDWAMQLHRKGQLEKIIDPVLVGKIKPASLRKFSETAAKCLKQKGIGRPNMRQVVYDLEYAQQLQEPVMQREQAEVTGTYISSLDGFQFHGAWNFPLQEDDEAPIEGDDDSVSAATETVTSKSN
ncbi:probable receptor-like protein kinase At5g24010 [Corylus avellana]|nr:probable receptor-like protein kinase At5g24010 [Corylus avellana]